MEAGEPEKRSCLFYCSVCSTSSPAPGAPTPEAIAAKGHVPKTVGLGQLRTGSLPSSGTSLKRTSAGSLERRKKSHSADPLAM